jgi:predicted dehydrogenase
MRDKLRVAFVGAGFMAQSAHIPNFLSLPEIEAVALAEPRANLAKKVAEYHHIPRVVSSHKDIAAMDEVDAVVAIMSEALHPAVAVDLLNAGKHVFIEKPLAPSVAVGEKMVEASRASGRLLMVGYMKRYDAGVQHARQIIAQCLSSCELGELTMIRVHCFGGGWTCGAYPRFSTDEPVPNFTRSPGPAFLPNHWLQPFATFVNVYCHNINLLRFLAQDEPQVLSAHRRGHTWLAAMSIGDALVSFEAGSISAHSWDEHVSFYFRHGRVDVFTPPPLLKNVSARVVVYRAGEEQQVVERLSPWVWGFQKEAQAFVSCCLHGEPCLSPAQDALQDLVVAERIAQQAITTEYP